MRWEHSSLELSFNKVQLGAEEMENYRLCTMGGGTATDKMNLGRGSWVLKVKFSLFM